VNDARLERKVFGITFKNPVGLAAGFDKDAKLYQELSNFGFGFIEIEGSKDVSVHHSAIKASGGRSTLFEGQKVTLEVIQGKKGLEASNVVAKN
jgi:cold shock CspA family protein